MTFLWLLYVICGLCLAGLALPLVAGRVPPNAWYGLRLPQTMSNPVTWYRANAYAGRYLLGAGLALALVASVLHWVPNMSVEVYAIACALVAVAGIALAATQAWRYLNRLP